MSGPFRRPCLTCGDLGPPGMSRCALHTSEHEAKRKRVRGATPVANKLRRTLNNLPLERCRNCALVYPVRFLRVDHIVPLIDGGADMLENLQILCKDCHGYKTRDEATARREAHYD